MEGSNGSMSLSSKTISMDFIMFGTYQNNLLIGDEGDNIIKSSAGHDILIGNAGDDTLTGGRGNDIFVYKSDNDGHDIITDFQLFNSDKLDISDLIDYQEDDDLADFVIIEHVDGDSVIHIDSDGAGVGDSQVSITLSDTIVSLDDSDNSHDWYTFIWL